MSVDENIVWLKMAKAEAKLLAEKTVFEMNLPTEVHISSYLITMGDRLNKIYLKEYEYIANKYEVNKLGKLAAEANRHYWLGCNQSSNLMKLIFLHEEFSQSSNQNQLSSPQGFADNEGWAYTLYDYVSSIENAKYLESDGFFEPNQGDLLTLIGLYWLNVAEISLENIKKFDYVAEALDAFRLAQGNIMWRYGAEFKEEEIFESRSNAAKRGIESAPKQMALKEIKGHYEASKHQFKRRGYTAQFVKDMSIRYPVIESQKTIENLVAKLKKDNKSPAS